MKIAATVVIYNPDINVPDNIESYINDVSLLVMVDNTETKTPGFVMELCAAYGDRIVYKHLAGNPGLAKALNIAATEALERNYDWLLTMDQDSRVGVAMLDTMHKYIARQNVSDIGIVSPFAHHPSLPAPLPPAGSVAEPLVVMNSGNLLYLPAYTVAGPYLEALFVDYVDYEYCLRLRRSGYRIVQVNNAVVHHQLGDIRRHRFLWKRPVATHHNALRRYYITRNRLYVSRLYRDEFPEFARRDALAFRKDLLCILLLEKDRLRKLAAVLRGIRDYRRGVLGKVCHRCR